MQFGGAMGWVQRNARWAFLGAILVFVLSLGASALIPNTPPAATTPTPTPSATASASATASSTASATPTLDPSITRRFSAPPQFTIDPNKSYTAVIKLQKGGEVRLQLLPKDAPQAVNNFVFLARSRFYEGLRFHRVLDFMAQGGDPLGNGTGGPGYSLPSERSALTFNDPGVVAMASSTAGVSGSQFFITKIPAAYLNGGNYPIFGKVTQGLDIVQKIMLRDPTKPNQPVGDVITGIEIIEGN